MTTFFLLDDEWRRLAESGMARLKFPHAHSPVCRYESLEDPLLTVGYEANWVEREAGSAGLALLQPPVPGKWSGRPAGPGQRPGYQDTVTLAPA